jgi:hypothetical protein
VTGRRGRLWAQVGLLVVASFLTYGRNLDDYFTGDDFDLIRSLHGKGLGYTVALLYNDESGGVWDHLCVESACPDPEHHGRHGFLRPLKMWLLRLDLALWGTRPLGYHVTGTLLFAANVVLILLVLRALLPPERGGLALCGAWVALVHPIFSGIVPSITFREELLATAAMLAALWTFLRHRRHGAPAAAYWLCCGLALLTKESAIVTVGLTVAYDATMLAALSGSRAELWSRARTHLPLLPILAGYFALRYAAFGNVVGGYGEPDFLSWELFSTFHTVFFMFQFSPPMFALHAFGWIRPAVVVTLAAAAVFLIVRRARLGRGELATLVFLGPVWYVVTTALAYSIYFSPRHVVATEIGLILCAAWGLHLLVRATTARAAVPLAAAMAALATVAFLPPTLAMSAAYDRAAGWVREVRAEIEAQAARLADGRKLLVLGIPQPQAPPPYFSVELTSALVRPFAVTDQAERITIDMEDGFRRLSPADYDQVLRIAPPGR